MKERPVLFSAPMVLALLAWRKTQTRRVLKFATPYAKQPPTDAEAKARYPAGFMHETGFFETKCPYGQPGDRLWVRETWRVAAWRYDGRLAVDYRASPELVRTPWAEPPREQFIKLTRESDTEAEAAALVGRGSVRDGDERRWEWDHGDSPCRWRPSIFMPRWASRLTIEVTGVRIERLQDIDATDAIAEGIDRAPKSSAKGITVTPGWRDYSREGATTSGPVSSYRTLWESINGAGSWDSNPWVWVMEFKRAPSGGA